MRLVFLPDMVWWHLGAGGRLLEGAGDEGAAPVVAVAPPGAVSLHRVPLPRLAPAQALAAARAMAGELSAAPADTMHVAIGEPDADGRRWLAIADAAAMAGWLAALDGLPVRALVPAPLLLPTPVAGALAWPVEGLWLVRSVEAGGEARAFASEPALAELVLGAAPRLLGADGLADGLAARMDRPELDLRQGRFAGGTRKDMDPARRRRVAVLAAAALAVLLATPVVEWARTNSAAAAAEAEAAIAAAALLPAGTPVSDPRAQVAARLAELGGGTGLARTMAPLLAELAGRPGVSIMSLEKTGDVLVVALEGAAPGDVAALSSRLQAAGLAAEPGLPREIGGRLQTELRIGG